MSDFLSQVNNPDDLKKLDERDLAELSDEIR